MDREYMFSPLSGALMEVDAANGILRCPVSGYQRKFAGVGCCKHVPLLERSLHNAKSFRSCLDLQGASVHSQSDMQVGMLPAVAVSLDCVIRTLMACAHRNT